MHTQPKPSFKSNAQPRWARRAAVVAAVWALTAIAATSAFAAGASFRPAPRHISAGAALGLPSTSQCVGRHQLTIQLHRIPGVKWIGGTVKVNGQRFESIGRSDIAQLLKIAGLPGGQIVFSITVRAANGLSVSVTRTYRSCAVKPGKSPSQSPPTKTPTTPNTPPTIPGGGSPPPSTTLPSSGTYSGSFGSLYVSADSSHLVDVSFPTVHLGCTPGGNPTNHFEIGEVALKPDGSFSSTTTQEGVLEGAPATFTYTFSGQAQGTSISGISREDIAYDLGGTHYSCSSNNWSWSMNRETQGSQAGPAPSGTYSGSFGSLYVSADSSHLVDVSFPTVHLGCTPGGNPTNHFEIGEVALKPDGSFSSTTTQEGVLEGAPATFTYTFSGHFHGYDSSGRARLAGIAREDIAFDKGGTHYSCSSNNWSWSMNRETQGSQAGPAPSGTYSGSFGSLYVSADSSHLVDVSFPTVHLGCTPGGNPTNHFEIGEVALKPDGSFSTTTTTTGPLFGATATFTYTFSGHFHGYDSSGRARLAGIAREDIAYNDGGTAYSCSSNNWSWSMSHS